MKYIYIYKYYLPFLTLFINRNNISRFFLILSVFLSIAQCSLERRSMFSVEVIHAVENDITAA